MTNNNIEGIIRKLDLIKASLRNNTFNIEMLTSLDKATDDYLQALRKSTD